MAGSTTLRVLACLLAACCFLEGGLAQGREPYSHPRGRRNDDYRPGEGRESLKPVTKTKDRPRNVTLEAYNATAISARWLPPRTAKACPVSRYIIRMKYEGQEQSTADRVLGTDTSVLLTDMRPDSRYLVRLVAVGCRGKSPPTKWVRTRTPALPGGSAHYRASRSESTVPGKPTRVRTRTLTDSIILSWEPPNDNILIRGFMVGYGEAVPDVNWQYVDASTRTFTIRNLKPSSQYVISLRAFNNFGKGLVVYDLVYTREDMGPTVGPVAAPIGLRSRVLSPRTVWLEWTDPSLGGAQKITDDRYYTVTFSEMPVGETRSLTVKALSVVIYDLTPSTTYEFRVKTRKGEEMTAYGISVYNTTYDAAPDTPPRMLTVVPSNASTTAVSVSWLPPEKPNGMLTGYLIFYADESAQDDPEEWTIEGVLGDIYHIKIEGFDPKVTYVFKIQARNAKGYSPISTPLLYCRQRMEGPETAPASLDVRPSNTSVMAVLVTWRPPERPNGTVLEYAISYQEAHGPGVLGEVWGIKRAPADVRHLVIEGVRPDLTYNFRIQARKADRYGPVSSVIVYRRPPEEIDDTETENESFLSVAEEGSNMLDDEAGEDQPEMDIREDKELPKPQFYKAPLEEDSEPEMNRRHSLDERDPERNGSQWSPPNSLRSLVRHHVSAVLTWDQERVPDVNRNVKYEVKYVRRGHHLVMTQHSTVPIFLLDNLVPNERYNYTITMHDGDALLWSFQGTLDTVDAA